MPTINGVTINPSASPKTVASSSYYGSIVSTWAAEGVKSSAEQANLNALAQSGGFAVKYHMDYTRVLEDAISKQIQAAASKVFRYTGQIDLAYHLDGGNLTNAINEFANVDIGSWINIVNTSGVSTASKIYDVGAGPFSLQGGDALLVKSKTPLLVDVVEDSKSVVASKPVDLSITVERNADGEYVLSVSDTYKTSVATDIATAVSNAAATQATNNTGFTNAINAEKDRAEAAELVLRNNLATEASTSRAKELELQQNITAEMTRAMGIEGGLRTDVDAEAARALAAEGVLDGKIGTETTRATTAEGVLTTNLAAEVTRATGAEGALNSAIAAEVTRALSAEGALSTAIAAETTARTTALEQEFADRATGDQVNADAIYAERQRALGIEGPLRTDLDAEISNRQTAVSGVVSSLATETSNRTSADSALSAKITSVNAALSALILAADERLDILEAFVAQTEQFVQLSDGSSVLDFSGSLAALTSAIPAAVVFA
jgi:hypothetical protein